MSSDRQRVEVVSHVVAIGPVLVPEGVLPGPNDNPRIDEDPVRCADPATSALMVAETRRNLQSYLDALPVR